MKAPRIPSITLTALFAVSGVRSLHAASVDPEFNPSISGGIVHSVSVSEDGRILVGGEFTSANGLPVARIARFIASGAVDSQFTAPTLDGEVFSAAAARNGSMYISGSFNTVAGTLSPNLAHLAPDGSFDGNAPVTSVPQGRVTTAAFSPAGDLYFGGQFRRVGNASATYLGRLDTTAAFDPSFNAALSSGFALEGGVDTLAVQNDGKILAAGTFETARGAEVLVRLNADGSLDSSFLPQGPILYCTAILPLNNGQILVGGLASSAGDGFVRRLNADGSVDATFNAPAFNDYVRAIALDAAGRVIVGGSFTAAGQQPHSRLARLNSDGSLDANWTLGANGIVKAMASDADGNLIVGGLFSQIGGQTHNGIARLLLQHAPSFKSMATGTNGHFTANLQADAGKTYAVETSSDLKSWTPFSIQTATISGLQIQDADASRKSLCFFRAKLIE